MNRPFTRADDERVEEALRRLSESAQFKITLGSLTDRASRFLASVERGYKFSFEEYLNDYSSRDLLLEVADDAPSDLQQRIVEWVREWDARFDRVTRPAADFEGTMSIRDDRPFRIPLRLRRPLSEDLADWGLI